MPFLGSKFGKQYDKQNFDCGHFNPKENKGRNNKCQRKYFLIPYKGKAHAVGTHSLTVNKLEVTRAK